MLPIVLDRMLGGCSGRVPLLSIESGAEHHRETDGRQRPIPSSGRLPVSIERLERLSMAHPPFPITLLEGGYRVERELGEGGIGDPVYLDRRVDRWQHVRSPSASPASLERCGCGLRNGMVLLSRSAADTDRTNDLPVLLQRNATSKNHDLAAVGSVDSKELIAGL